MNLGLDADNARPNRRLRWRRFKDYAFGMGMGIGGISVIAALLLIFVYLVFVVLPLFSGARVESRVAYPVPLEHIHALLTDEYAEVGFGLAADGKYAFFRLRDGETIEHGKLAPDGLRLRDVHIGDRSAGNVAMSFDDGSVLLVRPRFVVSFPNDRRQVQPLLDYPLGESPVMITTAAGVFVQKIAAESDEDQTTIASWTSDQRLLLTHIAVETSFLDEDEKTMTTVTTEIPLPQQTVAFLAIDIEQNELYVVDTAGSASLFDIRNKSQPSLLDVAQVVGPDVEPTVIRFLSGGTSLLIADNTGNVNQWFPVRNEQNDFDLTQIRTFAVSKRPIVDLQVEHFRKVFAAIDSEHTAALYHTTAARRLWSRQLTRAKPDRLAFSPRADRLYALNDATGLSVFDVHNPHPEVSLRSLWGKVWYEGRAEPDYIWQSSAATSDFEPKFSLTPLTFGTIKAAFYAMLFAVPIAILGAVYTAYFMHPRLRAVVKPSIEIMAALPTVILGFLAGLWLAPLMERHLIGFFLLLVLLPLAILICAYLADHLPRRGVLEPSLGAEVLVLVPILASVIAVVLNVDQVLEIAWFDGNFPRWLNRQLGVEYDQRNAVIVGLVMGFAVIPNIFSISEDAVFGVPKHLVNGSLALGATPWQTVTRVVLLTASPGIFSATMIGLGRAVGETMIVLMATGNTPVMDFSIFNGFRALSANIAVEMPESAVNSTHYRVLFLAALVLFILTFMFNTVAEVVRQRLRVRYGNL